MNSNECSPSRYLNNEENPLYENIRKLSMEGELGLLNLPQQVVKQRMIDGFTFNILCIGETGIGKSSLISSLFNIDLGIEVPLSHRNSAVTLESRAYSLDEEGAKLQVTVTETIGYGDQINMKDSYQPIVDYIDSHLEKYLQEEMRVQRSFTFFQDSRIHVCLFFICPTGHGLKALDLICLKNIHRKVNVIPVVAKADTLSPPDLERFKETIRKELTQHQIEIYDDDLEEDSSIFETNYSFPLAVVGSKDFVVLDGKMVRGRRYPWGTVVVEDDDHSEFCVLKEKLIQTNTIDLIERTHEVHYERFRRERLSRLNANDLDKDGAVLNLMQMECHREIELVREKNRLEKEEAIRSYLMRGQLRLQELMDEEELMKDKYRKLFLAAELEEKGLKEQGRMLENEILEFRKRKGQFRGDEVLTV